MSDALRAEDLLPHMDKAFRVRSGRHVLVLTALERFGAAEGSGPREPFLALFRGPPDDVLPEGLHAFEVEGRPPLEFYIMPIHTPARDRQDYQAVFN